MLKPEGIWVALVTPMTEEDTVDLPGLESLARWLIAEGVHGLVPLGTTGEGVVLTGAEREQILKTVVAVADEQVPVVAGTGSSSTLATIELCKQAEQCGVDGCLVVTPPYNRPSQAGLVAHYQAVARSTPLPIVLYSVPSRTGVGLEPESVHELALTPNVVALKDATGDMGLGSRIGAGLPHDFSLLSGDDDSALPLWSVGGTGVISVAAHVAPRLWVEMWNHFRAGNMERAREIHFSLLPLGKALFVESNPVPVKYALSLMGKCRAKVRLPLTELTEGGKQAVRQAMELIPGV